MPAAVSDISQVNVKNYHLFTYSLGAVVWCHFLV